MGYCPIELKAGLGTGRAARRHCAGGMGRRAGGARQAQAGGAQARGASAADKSWACGLCARAGPVGCSCTRLGFQPGFSTHNFS